MRHLVAGMLFVAVAVSAVVARGQSAPAPETEIRAMLDRYFAAYSKLDAATMDRLETDDFIFVQDGFVATKAQQMESLKKPGRKPGNMTFDFSFGKVWTVGDSAVVTGVLTVTPPDGKPLPGAFTHLLRRVAGEWRLQHSHYSTERPSVAPTK